MNIRLSTRTTALVCTIGLWVAAPALAQTTGKKMTSAELSKALQGDWVVSTVNGQSMANAGQTMMLSISGDKYSQTVDGTVNERGTLKIDASKSPATIDLTIAEGPDAGKTQTGVIQVKGETLTGHFSLPGASGRPSDFTPQEGFILFMATRRK
jgi:uncharacterized protein (TIGR03067 family)